VSNKVINIPYSIIINFHNFGFFFFDFLFTFYLLTVLFLIFWKNWLPASLSLRKKTFSINTKMYPNEKIKKLHPRDGVVWAYFLISINLICRQFTAQNSPRTIFRAQFTLHNSPRHNSLRAIHCAQFTTHNLPRTIHRAQFTVHNSPHTIYCAQFAPAQFAAAQFTATNSPRKIKIG
jgi:hypothetical protein